MSVNNPNSGDDESLGRAANRYVTFQIVSAIIGGIIFLIMLFAFFLPTFNHMNQGISSVNQTMPSGPGGPMGQTTTSVTVDGHPASPEEQKAIEQQINAAPPVGSPPK